MLYRPLELQHAPAQCWWTGPIGRAPPSCICHVATALWGELRALRAVVVRGADMGNERAQRLGRAQEWVLLSLIHI